MRFLLLSVYSGAIRVMTLIQEPSASWSRFHKIAFRFMAVYSCLHIFYTLLRFRTIPGLTQLHKYIWPFWRGIVEFVNNNILQIRSTLVEPNTSTDTSFSWASQFTMLLIACLAAIAWTAFDRKRTEYQKEEYWLRVAMRYFIAYFSLYYGIIKLFGLQMPYPSLSQLSTPLGDLSPTRVAWMFVGASTFYQVFSGIIETSAGLFLMYRRTTTLGLVLALGVFANIVALNFGYDISAKLMSIHFLLFIMYLLSFEWRRIFDFFFLNKPTAPTDLYRVNFSDKQRKYARIVVKGAFIYVAIISTIILSIQTYKSYHLKVDTTPIQQGIYDVDHFSLNGDSVLHDRDSLIWKDLVLYGVTGSINTSDTIFTQRYERGYFYFNVDTVARQLIMKSDYYSSDHIMKLNYEMPDPKTIRLSGKMRNDSLRVVLKKSNKVFRLPEDQFNWIQEATE